jgi:polar amino acid transport system substrate-binding protein
VHPYSDLVSARVDAVLLDHIIAERALHRHGNTGFVILARPVAAGRYVGVLARRDSLLRDSIDVVLRETMRDGSLEAILRRWNVWDDSQQSFFDRSLRAEISTRPINAGKPAQVILYLPSLARAAAVTLLLSFLSMALVRILTTGYIVLIRGAPLLLQLFVIYYGLAGVIRLPAFLAAMLALGLNYAAYEAEIYRGALEAVSRTQLEAARTLGFSEAQILRLVRGPQALRYALAPMTNDFVALLKDSSLVSVITVVELTKQTAIYATNVGSWIMPGALCAAVYLAMSLPLSRLARRLEQRWKASAP